MQIPGRAGLDDGFLEAQSQGTSSWGHQGYNVTTVENTVPEGRGEGYVRCTAHVSSSLCFCFYS